MKTTKAQFKEFQERCLYWQNRFGLGDWELSFNHKKLDNAYAQVFRDFSSMEATVEFSTITDNNLDINKSACHEILHLVLGDLTARANAYYSESIIKEEEHGTINRLLKVILNN